MRIGTLAKLTYAHFRKDLEAGIVPVHIHVEAEITKGKYQTMTPSWAMRQFNA